MNIKCELSKIDSKAIVFSFTLSRTLPSHTRFKKTGSPGLPDFSGLHSKTKNNQPIKHTTCGERRSAHLYNHDFRLKSNHFA